MEHRLLSSTSECSWMYQDSNWGACLLVTVPKVTRLCLLEFWVPSYRLILEGGSEVSSARELGRRKQTCEQKPSSCSHVLGYLKWSPDHLPKLWDPARSQVPASARARLSSHPWEQHDSVPYLQQVLDKYTLKCYMNASFTPPPRRGCKITPRQRKEFGQQRLLCLLASLYIDTKLLWAPVFVHCPV